MPALNNLGSAVTAPGGAEEPELAEPVRALRQAGARAELPSIKPGQIQPVQHDLQQTPTFAAGKTPGDQPAAGDIAAVIRDMLNLFAAARGA